MGKKRPKVTKEGKVHEPVVVTAMRVAEVTTQHGVFYRLIKLETTDGQVSNVEFANNYFNEPHEIAMRAADIEQAMMMPIITLDSVSTKH